MSESGKSQPATRKYRRLTGLVLLVCALALMATGLWLAGFTVGASDPLFRGKPESEWVKNLKYWDDDQVKEWQGYGEEGVQVLVRGLRKANHPGEQTYRELYRKLPRFATRLLPAPKPDSTRSTRMCIVSLISSLGNAASNATPIMIRTVNRDEADSVRQLAINFFTTSEDEHCRLNNLAAADKQALLPGLLRGLRDPGNWGLRNNAANALRWYPEQRERVAPALVPALQDSQPQVRLVAAEALNRVDPTAAKRAGAALVVVRISKLPDDQIASRAAGALKHFKFDADIAVPALIDCLTSTNTLVACDAVWALEWAPPEFKGFSSSIIPALQKAAQRKDNVARYAKVALARYADVKASPQPDR